jgi:low affinity Fe/Cu permease
MQPRFRRLAQWTSSKLGTPIAFICAVIAIAAWAFAGPYFNFSENWQLLVNTGTTILTFLMVFLIQNTQNRDSQALHLKLDELIRAIGPARDSFIDIENEGDDELAALRNELKHFRDEVARKLRETERIG